MQLFCHPLAIFKRKACLNHHPFVEREVSTAPTMIATEADTGQFMARIEDILPTGEIVLCDTQGNRRTYHFKQIRFVV